MATLAMAVFTTLPGCFVNSNETIKDYPTVRQYLEATDPVSIVGKNRNSLKNRIYRVGKSEAFLNWQKENTSVITPEPAGVVVIEYDGRLPEYRIKSAIIAALNAGRQYIEVEPLNNANKQAHEQLVYIKKFEIK